MTSKEKTRNVPSTPSLTPMEKSLKNIESLLRAKGYQTLGVPLKTGPIGGLVKMDERQESAAGSPHGNPASVKTLNGNWRKIKISRDKTGIALAPQLKERDWLLIDGEIAAEKYNRESRVLIKEGDQDYWLENLAQGRAALEVSPFEHTLSRLTRLKLQKPTANMDENATAVFFEDLCDHFEARGYCYHAIDQGITRLIEREEDKFFPTMKMLLCYIHPLHWTLRERVRVLENILHRSINKESLLSENKEKFERHDQCL